MDSLSCQKSRKRYLKTYFHDCLPLRASHLEIPEPALLLRNQKLTPKQKILLRILYTQLWLSYSDSLHQSPPIHGHFWWPTIFLFCVLSRSPSASSLLSSSSFTPWSATAKGYRLPPSKRLFLCPVVVNTNVARQAILIVWFFSFYKHESTLTAFVQDGTVQGKQHFYFNLSGEKWAPIRPGS